MPVNADGLPGTAAPGDPAPPSGLVVVGRYDQLPGYRVDRPRGADSWLFTWTTGGHGRLRQGAAEDRVAVANGTAARELALTSLEEIVLLTAATARTPAPPPGVDARVRRAEALIAADPGAPHTVCSLAESVSLSPSRFAHLFTR